MYVLAIETTGPVGSVALGDLGAEERMGAAVTAAPEGATAAEPEGATAAEPEGAEDKILRYSVVFSAEGAGRVTQKVTNEPMGHLRNLMAMAEELLEEAGASPKDVGAVACSVGPGSYTGIRIGVSSARAIAQALGVPAISVGALDQFRLVAARLDRPVAVIFNARRGQVYGAVYGVAGNAHGDMAQDGSADLRLIDGVAGVRDVLPPGPYMLTDVLEKTADLPDVIFYGDGVDAYRDQLDGYELAPEEERYPTAALTLQAAVAQIAGGTESAGRPEIAGRTESADGIAQGQQGFVQGAATEGRQQGAGSYEELLPRYMRETEAEQKLRDGTLAKLREAKMAKFRSM